MANTKNLDELHRLRMRLISLADFLEDYEAMTLFKSDKDVVQLNRKSFMQIVYFLFKSVSRDLTRNLPWPVTNIKGSEIFLKGVFKNVEDLKKEYPWSNIPHFQKSHFQDPRPENDKVVEFLLKLSSLTIHVVTGIRPGEEIQEIRAKIQALVVHCEELRKELEKLETAKRGLEEREVQLSTQAAVKKQQLLDEGVIQSLDDFIISKLFVVKEKMERELLECVKTLQNLKTAVLLT